MLIEMLTFSFKKMHLKMSSAKWRSFCLGINALIDSTCNKHAFLFVKNFVNNYANGKNKSHLYCICLCVVRREYAIHSQIVEIYE